MSNANVCDEIRLIEVKEEIFADNRKVADDLRSTLKKQKTFLLNLIPEPIKMR